MNFTADWHVNSEMLVARSDESVVGFLRFVVQPIGPDADCPEIVLNGERLIEAKVIACGVAEAHRRRGVGRALQKGLIEHARALNCYQIRSHSGGDHPENHALKLAMGFGVHPIVRGGDTRGAYFILPLRTQTPR